MIMSLIENFVQIFLICLVTKTISFNNFNCAMEFLSLLPCIAIVTDILNSPCGFDGIQMIRSSDGPNKYAPIIVITAGASTIFTEITAIGLVLMSIFISP